MRYFIDTEFADGWPHEPIHLISIGVVAEDGEELYRENMEARSLLVSDWVAANVIPHLAQSQDNARYFHDVGVITSVERIAEDIRTFIGDDTPEFWGYFCAFDYVVLSHLMGGMDEWPQGWPYYMHDLRQGLDALDLTHIRQPDDAVHSALLDARWIREEFLRNPALREGK